MRVIDLYHVIPYNRVFFFFFSFLVWSWNCHLSLCLPLSLLLPRFSYPSSHICILKRSNVGCGTPKAQGPARDAVHGTFYRPTTGHSSSLHGLYKAS